MKKRLLAIFLSLCLVMGILSTPVFAASDDLTPPVVKSISMNSPGGTVVAGDTLYFDIEVEDESEITGGYLNFYADTTDGRNSISTQFVSYNSETHIVKMTLQIQDDTPSGVWRLNSVAMSDYYGNSITYRKDYLPGDIPFDDYVFTVSETSGDLTPPVVKSVSMDNPGGTVIVGDTLYFDVEVEDKSEVTGGYLSFYADTTDGRNSVSTRFVSYDSETHIVKMTLQIQDDTPSGVWRLNSVAMSDYYGNSITYRKDYLPGDIPFDDYVFTVSETSGDLTPPVVKSVSMDNPGGTVIVGDTLYFDVEVEDKSEVTGGYLSFYADTTDGRNSVSTRFVSYDSETHIVKMMLPIQDNIPSGVWRLNSVTMSDYYGNSITYRKDYSPGDISFDNYIFTVASTETLPDSVSIPDTIEVRVRDVHTIRPTVTPATSVPKWVWTSADTSIAEVHNAGGGTSCNITGIAPGTTTITGTTQNGLTASCEVTVTDAPLPESGTVNELYHVGVGSYVDIAPVLTPANATTLYEVTSDNPHVAGIATTAGHTGVRIEGNNPGTATITIRGANNLVMTTTVKVGNDSDRQHEKTTVAGYAPTCTREGRTGAVRCSACWYIFTEAEVIPATGHSFGDWTVITNATATASGLKERVCASCGYRETEVIPATGNPSGGGNSSGDSGSSGGNSSSGGSSSGGGSSGSTSNPSSSNNQTGNITANNQSIPAKVNNNVAEVTATEKQLSEIIEKTVAGDTVKFDVSAEEKVSEISIPQNAVKAINGNENISGLSITMQSGSIEMSGDALQTVSDALTGSNDHLAIKVNTVDIDAIPSTQKYPIANVLSSAVFVELSASIVHKDNAGKTVSTEALHEFGGNVTVSVPYERPADMEGRQIIACYIADDGAITYFPVKYESGIATFTTTHFSTFAVLESRAATFQDVDISAWYMTSVEYALQSGLMGGYNSERFGTNDNLSRAQLAQILYNKEGRPAVTDGSSFADVAPGAWCAPAITWAAERGIVGGYGNGMFGPDDNITREQLAVMLWRYAGSPAATDKELHFTDADKASGYALEALRWAVENCVINGKGGGILDPKGLATRAQVAQMLKNYLNR